MPAIKTRADSLREYLTGAIIDGLFQSDPNASKGNFRSSSEAVSLGISIANAISNVTIQYAGGGNPVGAGTLTALDPNTLTWQPFGATGPGPAVFFPTGTTQAIIEGNGVPGQYLRLLGTPPFSIGSSTITLSYLVDNVFGLSDVSIADAAAGISDYRATILRNESLASVQAIQRWIAQLGTPQFSDTAFLASTGSGQIITSGSFADWPFSGWCRIQDSVGNLREIVYYNSRTQTTLFVDVRSRSMLGTFASGGFSSDVLYSVPGVAIGLDPTKVTAFGKKIQAVTSFAPSGVVWNTGITSSSGLQIGTMAPNTQIGVWIWRHVPGGAVSSPLSLTKFNDLFNAF